MSLPQIAGLELQDLIGKGSCGAVYRAVTADNRTTAAVKVFSSMAINRKLLGIAMRGLQQMPEHPGLLPVTAFDFDSSPYFVATPLVGFTTEDGKGRRTWETPTLESCCGNVGPEEAWRYIYEVCDAMAWLHKHNLVHCNLKPRNVLLEDDPASATKITDVVQGWIGGVHHFEATDHFMYVPPEQAEHPDALATQGTAWDVYAFGVVAYRLLTGRFPRAEEEYERQRKRHTGDRGGVSATFDNPAIMAAVRRQPEIGWPTKTRTKWDERRRRSSSAAWRWIHDIAGLIYGKSCESSSDWRRTTCWKMPGARSMWSVVARSGGWCCSGPRPSFSPLHSWSLRSMAPFMDLLRRVGRRRRKLPTSRRMPCLR
ncbi:serine/threonine protein kinase [Verrucomicrobium spinosum]|uniref:serine/threonine protein kinase n=1 Tax=Verrucomicrobium spinosum TaxID=2736 RepID=UPI000946509F|nr:protein kinase [Verrucomicrobium spinosum]